MKPNPEPLKKALRALKKCHDEVAGGQRDLPVMLAQLESEREKTDPSDLIRVRNLGELQIRCDLMPKFIGQSMAKTKKLSDALRAEIESLWGQLEKSLEAAQESFKDQHEKALRPLFGDRARDILNHCPLIPCPNWSPEDRQALALVYVPQETSQNPADNYPKNAAYDRQLIAHAERLLEICETFLASSSK